MPDVPDDLRLERPGARYAMSRAEDECDPGAPCGICGTPLAPEHLHAYYDAMEPIDWEQVDASATVITNDPDTTTGDREYARALLALREGYDSLRVKVNAGVKAGLCSEGCAIRWAAGELTPEERADI